MHTHAPFGVIVALVTTAAGVIASAVNMIWAQSTATVDFGPWVSGGGAAAAVAGLVYIAKKLAAGELVAVPVAQLMHKADEREQQLQRLLDDSKEREDSLRLLIIDRSKR